MAMMERMKAAALMLKCKVLLLKDKGETKKREKKWETLRDTLDKKEGESRKAKGEEEKTVAYQSAILKIENVIFQVKEYNKEIDKILKLIKETSILDDSEKLKKFNKDVKANLEQQDRIYTRYKTKKGEALNLLKKAQVKYKKDFDDRLIGWIKKDKPMWELFKKSATEFLKDSVQLSLNGVKVK